MIILQKCRDYCSKISRWIESNLESAVFVSLLILSVGVRFWLVPHVIDWNDDIAQNQLLARLVLVVREPPTVGPGNSGLGLYYPTYIYYFFAALRFIQDSYSLTLAVVLMTHMAAVFFLYLLTRMLGGKAYALFATCLFLVSLPMIRASVSTWTAYLALPLSIVTIWLTVLSVWYGKYRYITLLAAIFIGSFATTVHYGATLNLVFIFFVILTRVKQWKQKIMFSLLLAAEFVGFNIPSIVPVVPADFLYRNIRVFAPALLPIVGVRTWTENLTINIGPNLVDKADVLLPVCLVVGILFGLWLLVSVNDRNKFLVLCLFCIIAMSILIATFAGPFHFGMSQYPFIFVVISIFLEAIAKKLGHYKFLGVLLALGIYYAVFPASALHDSFVYPDSSYALNQKLYTRLIHDVGDPDSTTLYLSMSREYNGVRYWKSLNIWYVDSLSHIDNYSSTFSFRCLTSVIIGGVCFAKEPTRVVLICPFAGSSFEKLLGRVERDLCKTELVRLQTLVGLKQQRYAPAGEFNIVLVDSDKVSRLQESITYN